MWNIRAMKSLTSIGPSRPTSASRARAARRPSRRASTRSSRRGDLNPPRGSPTPSSTRCAAGADHVEVRIREISASRPKCYRLVARADPKLKSMLIFAKCYLEIYSSTPGHTRQQQARARPPAGARGTRRAQPRGARRDGGGHGAAARARRGPQRGSAWSYCSSSQVQKPVSR